MSSGMGSNCTNAQLHIKSGKEIAVWSLPGSQICSFGGANPAGNRGLWMFAPAMVGTDLPPFGYSVVWFRWESVQTAFADHLIFALPFETAPIETFFGSSGSVTAFRTDE